MHTGPIEKKVKYYSSVFIITHQHYGQYNHNGIGDWQFTLIEQCEKHEQLKETETFWQNRAKIFYPYGLNEKKEYLY